MKKNIFIVALGLALTSLTGCFQQTQTKTLTMTSLFDGTSEEVKCQINKGEDLIPYFTLPSYFQLYSGITKDNYVFSIRDNSVQVKNPAGELCFVAQFNNSSYYVYAYGDYSDAFTCSKDYSNSSLMLQLKNDVKVLDSSASIKAFSFKDKGFKVINNLTTTLYPLSLLESIFSHFAGVHHFFNYQRIVQFDEY